MTGAGSGLDLERARMAAKRGMSLALPDVQQDALDAAASERRTAGADVLPVQTRLEDLLQARNPSHPFMVRPAVGEQLKAAFRQG